MLNGLDLFSGIGGISLALSEWVRPMAYCEIDPYCQSVILSSISTGRLGLAPIWDDIRTLGRNQLQGLAIDIIYGGFPCQDISVAGLGKGLAGERSGLFYEILRLAKEIRPKFIVLENTKGILSNGGIEVIESLAFIGYSCRWITKSCKEVGSPQSRERWFCLAYSSDNRLQEKGLSCRSTEEIPKSKLHVEYKIQPDWPKDKSPLLGMDDDVPFWVDRIKSLGNSVCVEQTKEAFKELMGLK